VLSAAILYVQVEGEAAIAEETLQQTDSVQTVVKRAAEARDIERIDWKDVAGWRLTRPDGSLVADGDSNGGRSEPLTKLLPFPDESLLIIRRRPPPLAAASSASWSASGKKAPPADHNSVGAVWSCRPPSQLQQIAQICRVVLLCCPCLLVSRLFPLPTLCPSHVRL
jgi:hypothetical protein